MSVRVNGPTNCYLCDVGMRRTDRNLYEGEPVLDAMIIRYRQFTNAALYDGALSRCQKKVVRFEAKRPVFKGFRKRQRYQLFLSSS